MTTYMHCQPCCGTNISICSTSFVFVRPSYITTSNYQTYTPPSHHHHDHTPPSLITPRCRRRLEDPITTYASNYYAAFPHLMSRVSSSPPPASQPPPLPPPPPHRIFQQPYHNDAYCDLYNLLEHPSPPSSSIIKQRRKYDSNDSSSHRHYRPTDFENVYTKPKNTNERKRRHQQTGYYKEKKYQDDKLSSTEQYDQSTKKIKKIDDIYQRRSRNKGFFRRVVRNYFCMPSTFANNGYSS